MAHKWPSCRILGFKFQYYQHMEFFDGYEYHVTSFEQTYQCYPASFIEKFKTQNGSVPSR
ncbi:hypothetical protein HN51_027297 [Arachis hypogaea]